MKSLPLLLLLLAPIFARAETWSPVLACEGNAMVVDRSDGDDYQLVIRNRPEVLNYFSSKADISHAVNEKGEMIVSLSTGGPLELSSSLFVGYVSGETSVLVSRNSSNEIRVGLWQVGYRGTHSEEVANWVFRGCSGR